jgi:eukaryotic-like serine/threonine-protein kinase
MFLEAQAMAASEHPNLACVYGLEMWRATPILIVEHLPGGTLSERLRKGPLALDEALSIGAQLADALEALHRDGTLHRDIKPSNIGFGRAGAPKLLDFGLARLLGPIKRQDRVAIAPSVETSDATAIAGTPLYLSPESLAGGAADEYVDLWALSLVVFEAIAGAHPFAAMSVHGVYRRIRTEQPNLRLWQPDVPAAVEDFMIRALALDRSRRPATARQLASELRHLTTLR